jgi:transposase
MEHFEEIELEDLQQALEEVENKKPTQRLTAAIAYKKGVTQTELAEWFGVQRRTIYNWLKRLKEEPLEQAVTDAHRSGRSRKIDEDQQNQLREALNEPPIESGYDAPAWTPALFQRYLDDAFDAEYSKPSCRRLMKEAGLSYQKPRRKAAEADPEDSKEFDEELKKSDGRWTLP